MKQPLIAIVLGALVVVGSGCRAAPVAETTNEEVLSDRAIGEIIEVDALVGNVPLSGAGPQGLDVDLASGKVYVANNGAIVSKCEGGASQDGIAKPPGDRAGASTLSVVDPVRLAETLNVATGGGPVWPLVDDARGVVYVAGSGVGIVTVHDLATGEIEQRISVGGKPHAFGLKGDVLVVSNTRDTTQTFMSALNADTLEVTGSAKVGDLPHGIAYDSTANAFYMVGVKDGTVAVIDADTGEVTGTFAGTDGAFGNSNMLAFSDATRRLFVSDTKQTSSVTVVDVDTKKIVGTISFGSTRLSSAWGMQVDDAAGLLYVALPNADAIGVADVETLEPLALVAVDECPYAVRLDTVRGLGFSTGMVNATVSVVDLTKILDALGRGSRAEN